MNCDERSHACLCGLNADGQEALRKIIAKFRSGDLEHGPVNIKKGAWRAEMMNEFIDQAMYSIFELMKMEREDQGKS